MIQSQVKKRNVSFIIWLVLIIIGTIVINIAEISSPVILIAMIIQLIGGFFGYKACYHWCKAKGYSGWMALWSTLGFIGFIIFAILNDKTVLNQPQLMND